MSDDDKKRLTQFQALAREAAEHKYCGWTFHCPICSGITKRLAALANGPGEGEPQRVDPSPAPVPDVSERMPGGYVQTRGGKPDLICEDDIEDARRIMLDEQAATGEGE